MRSPYTLTGACLAAVVLLCSSASAGPRSRVQAGSSTSSRQEIEALESRYNNAFNTRDVDGIMSCYAPGRELFVFDAVPPREYPSWDDYKRDWETLFSMYSGPASNQISEQSITVVGPVAYGHNIQSTTFTNKDGSQVHLVVRVTDVYRKIGKKWLIVQEHVSFPVNVATGQADLQSKP
ncbi:MAG TPA: nuclear transport factor 2 family protein [Candidatus Acidoferrum sp.]|nr:nuclear transport factor 2 family protein [Candidatus Acidoferrum sp.]